MYITDITFILKIKIFVQQKISNFSPWPWVGEFDKISQVSLPQGVRQWISIDILKIYVPTFPRGWGGAQLTGA